MSDHPVGQSNATSRFFTNYLKYLTKHSIPKQQRRWYVKHIETFIKAQNGNKIKSLSQPILPGILKRQAARIAWKVGNLRNILMPYRFCIANHLCPLGIRITFV